MTFINETNLIYINKSNKSIHANTLQFNLTDQDNLDFPFIKHIFVLKSSLQGITHCYLHIGGNVIIELNINDELDALCDVVLINKQEYIDLFSTFLHCIPINLCRYHTVCVSFRYVETLPHTDIQLILLPCLEDHINLQSEHHIKVLSKVSIPQCTNYALSRCSQAIFKGNDNGTINHINVFNEDDELIYVIPNSSLQKLRDTNLYLWSQPPGLLETYTYTKLNTSHTLINTYRKNTLCIRHGMAGLIYCLTMDTLE